MERLTEPVCGRYRLKPGYALDTLRGVRAVVDRLAAYEDAEEAGRLVVLPDNADCDTCPLCGDYGGYSITGYPPEPDKCRDTIRKEAEAALGGDKRK